MWGIGGKIALYIYDQSRLINNNPCGVYTLSKDVVLKIGQWQQLRLYIRLNSNSTQSDGIAELWIDRKLIIQRTGIPFRGENAATVDHILFSTFYGGSDASWAPSKTTYIRFDNITLYKGKATNLAV